MRFLLRKLRTLIKIIHLFCIRRKYYSEIRRNGGYVQTKGLMFDVYGNFIFGNNLIINTIGVDIFTNSHIVVCQNAVLSIGNNSGITSTAIYCAEKIEIGNYVNIGAGCLVMDTNFHSTNWEIRMDRKKDIINAKTAPVKIDDFVFIGARSIICKGVHIGEKSLVAAGSVVVKDIPAGELWGGNPAKFIKKITTVQ